MGDGQLARRALAGKLLLERRDLRILRRHALVKLNLGARRRFGKHRLLPLGSRLGFRRQRRNLLVAGSDLPLKLLSGRRRRQCRRIIPLLELRRQTVDFALQVDNALRSLLARRGGSALLRERALTVRGVELCRQLANLCLTRSQRALALLSCRRQSAFALAARLRLCQRNRLRFLALKRLGALVQLGSELLIAHLAHDVRVPRLINRKNRPALGALDLVHRSRSSPRYRASSSPVRSLRHRADKKVRHLPTRARRSSS